MDLFNDSPVFDSSQKQFDLVGTVHSIIIYRISVRPEFSFFIPIAQCQGRDPDNFCRFFYCVVTFVSVHGQNITKDYYPILAYPCVLSNTAMVYLLVWFYYGVWITFFGGQCYNKKVVEPLLFEKSRGNFFAFQPFLKNKISTAAPFRNFISLYVS